MTLVQYIMIDLYICFCLFFNRCPVQYTGKRCEMIDTDYLLALFGVSTYTCRHSFKMKYTLNRFPFEDNLDILTTRSHWKRVLQFLYEISYLLKCSTCQRHAIILSYFLNKSQDIKLKKIPNNLNTNFTGLYNMIFVILPFDDTILLSQTKTIIINFKRHTFGSIYDY